MTKIADAGTLETYLNKFIIRTSIAENAVIKRRKGIPTEEVAQKDQITKNLDDMNDNNAYNKVFNKDSDVDNDFLRIARKGTVAFLNIFVGLPRAIKGIFVKPKITKEITLPRTFASAAQAFANLFQNKAVEQKSEESIPQKASPPPPPKDVNKPPTIQEHTTPPPQTENPPSISKAKENKNTTTTESDQSGDVEVSKIYGSPLEAMQAEYKSALDKLEPHQKKLAEDYKNAETEDERASAKDKAKKAFLEAFNGPAKTAAIIFERVIHEIDRLCELEKRDQDEQEKSEDSERKTEELMSKTYSFEEFFNSFSKMKA